MHFLQDKLKFSVNIWENVNYKQEGKYVCTENLHLF